MGGDGCAREGLVTKEGEVIMEVKVAGPYPAWLRAALREAGAFPQSFSKYGEAYRICMRDTRQAIASRLKASQCDMCQAHQGPVLHVPLSVPVEEKWEECCA